MSSNMGYRGGLALGLALLCLGLLLCLGQFVSAASAAEFKYVLDPELSLTGDCSTTPGGDEVKDPDCEPTYPPPPDGPSGRFDRPYSVAVDDWGNLYVASRSGSGTDGRIDIFDSEGRFISELDDPNGPQSIAVDGEGNLYAYEKVVGVAGADPPAVVRYAPTVYNPAAGEIVYEPEDRTIVTEDVNFISNALTIDRADAVDPADDRLYIAEGERISIYSSAEDGNTLVDRFTPTGPSSAPLNSARTIALDSERRLLYVPHCKSPPNNCVVWVLDADAPYTFIKEITGSQTPAGKFFSIAGQISLAVDETNGHLFIGDVAKKTDIYELDTDYELVSSFKMPGGAQEAAVHSTVAETPNDLDAKNHRYLYVPISDPSGSAIAFAPPEISPPEVELIAVRNIGETEAELEGVIKPGQLETPYVIEYVSEAQFAIDGYESATVAESGTLPAVKPPQRVSALITGLVAGTDYRFRIFAENEIGDDEAEAFFATFDDAPISTGPCSNDARRVGPSAALPDCRAWELVTPPGARGPAGASFEGQRFGMVQASPGGEEVSFEINAGALPGTEASGYFHGDPYLASRTESGWSTSLAGPTGQQATKPKPGSFSPDQGHSFWTADGQGSAVIGGTETHYVRYPDGRSELIGRGSLGTDPRALGMLITEGGTHIIFQTTNFPGKAQQLEPNAPPEGVLAVYDRTADEVTHVVSLLPGDVTPTQAATYAGASADGEGIAFKIGTTLYLRVGNAATYGIGTGVTFAGVSEGGDRVFYVEGGDLKAFDVSSEEVMDFTGSEISSAIPVNVAPQGTRAYFVSETAVGGANPNGDVAQPGGQNLYLSEDGAITFVATVTERDVEGFENVGTEARGDGLGRYIESLAKRQPPIASSRLTDDGQVFVFQSRANLDGYESGEDSQIYRYDSASERLHCVSCPPTKTPAQGGAKLQALGTLEPAPFSASGFVPALTSDGERLFFESNEALVSSDIDELRDVYEWEEAGKGSCTRPGGCVYLISSGTSAHPDFLFGHSASGDDVFVSTYDVLAGSGEETIAIYDARVGGGFASEPVIDCAEEGCKGGLTPPPLLPTPQSPVGPPGNVQEGKKPKKCPRGKRKVKRKGKVVCVKKKKKGKGGKATAKRRASR